MSSLPAPGPAVAGLPAWLAAEITAAQALEPDPVLRNLRITQSYCEISEAFSRVTGAANVNWCTFAVWASKTAGTFIRMKEDELLVGLESVSADIDRAIKRLNRYLLVRLPESTLIDLAGQIVTTTSSEIAQGNFEVYNELAPLFGQLLVPMDDTAFQDFLGSLRPGSTAQGGQDLLGSAFTHYRNACASVGSAKCELMLMASAQTGLHEQTRLQRYIAGALDAPVDEILNDIVRKHARFPLLMKLFEPIVALFRRPVVRRVKAVWLQFATRYLMTLALPDGTLHLGEDLCAVPGQPLFPPDLQKFQNGELVALLKEYGADVENACGSGARDWTDLHQRMRYIIDLFRSRQQDMSLFDPPFLPAQVSDINAGIVPGGAL